MNKTDLNSLQISTNARQIEGIGHTKAGLKNKISKQKETDTNTKQATLRSTKTLFNTHPEWALEMSFNSSPVPLGMGMENVKRFSLFSTATILLDLPIRGTQVRIVGNWLALKNT